MLACLFCQLSLDGLQCVIRVTSAVAESNEDSTVLLVRFKGQHIEIMGFDGFEASFEVSKEGLFAKDSNIVAETREGSVWVD